MINLQRNIWLWSILGFLRCNQDNTISSTVTIKCSRRCILQHRHWLNIVRVQLSNVTFIRSTINDIKRLVSAIYQCSDTTNMNLWSLTWFTIRVVNLYTWSRTFQCTCYRSVDTIWNFLRINNSYRTRKRLSFCCTISNNNNFIKFLVLRIQCNLHVRCSRNSLWIHTDVWNNQLGTSRSREFKVTINIGNSTVLRTRNKDRSTDNRLLILGRDYSSANLSLRQRCPYT